MCWDLFNQWVEKLKMRVPSLVEDDIPKGQPLTSTITTIRISRWQSDVEIVIGNYNLRNCNFLKLS